MLELRLNYKNSFIFILIVIAVLPHVFGKELKDNDKLKSPENNIYVDSEILTIDRLKNSAIFEGSVVLEINDMIIHTSVIEIIYKNDDKDVSPGKQGLDNKMMKEKVQIEKIIIPNKLQAIKEEDNEILIANEGEFIMDEGKLILTGDIKLMHQDSILKTQKLIYYIDLLKTNLRKIK